MGNEEPKDWTVEIGTKVSNFNNSKEYYGIITNINEKLHKFNPKTYAYSKSTKTDISL